jgi:signal transduction histidine kinase
MSLTKGGGATATLSVGVLAFRWAAVAWMAILAIAGRDTFVREPLAWSALAVTAVWVIILTSRWSRPLSTALWIDLGLSVGLLAVSALVAPQGAIDDRPLFAAAYPFAAVVGWGARWGVAGGLIAGTAIGLAYIGTRPLNGIPLGEVGGEEWQSIANAAVNFVIAGGAVGMVSRLLKHSAEEVVAATQQTVAAREHAARLVEREAMGRAIHDSILQSLSLINKRSRELAGRDSIAGEEVAGLGELAARQEKELRRLVLREPEPGPGHTASLRELLEATAADFEGLNPSVSAAGSLWVPNALASELVAATREALTNVTKHASARNTTVFAAIENGDVVVSVRDDGSGFDYREDRLRIEKRAGVLRSMKGRIEDLGGTVRIESAPGKGTEVEFRVPLGAR